MMMRVPSGVSITYAYVLSFVLALLPTTSLGGSKGEKSNDLAIEFLGRCGWYSVSYQRLIDKLVGLEASTSVISESGVVLAYFAGGFRAYLSSSDASGFVVGGLAVASQGGGYVSSRLFSRWSSTTYMYFGPGVEYRSPAGFLVRGTLYFLVLDREVRSWPGVQIGIAF